ncbi:MAG: plasmid stabilization system protein ParE [Rubritalea sp.]
MKAIRYHPSVQDDINGAMKFYFIEATEKVAHEFWAELSESLIKIRQNPTHFHFSQPELRRCNLKKFPYHILFLDNPDKVRIQVVRHNSRRPAYGTKRKRN